MSVFSDFKVGTRVSHAKFGKGTVTELHEDHLLVVYDKENCCLHNGNCEEKYPKNRCYWYYSEGDGIDSIDLLTILEKETVNKNKLEDFVVGTRVSHADFGEGVVSEVEEKFIVVVFLNEHPMLHDGITITTPGGFGRHLTWFFVASSDGIDSIDFLTILEKVSIPESGASTIKLPPATIATKDDLLTLKDLLVDCGIDSFSQSMKFLDKLLGIPAKDRLLEFLEDSLDDDDFGVAETLIEELINEKE